MNRQDLERMQRRNDAQKDLDIAETDLVSKETRVDRLNDVIKNLNESVEANERAAGVNLPPTAQRIGVPNYEVHKPELEATLRSISGKITGALPPGNKWGFMLMLFEYGPGGATFYASSADRDDTIAVMKEWIAKQAPSTEGDVS